MRLYRTNTTWRDCYNPLRGLSMAGIVGMEEQAETGDIANLQWLWKYMCKSDDTLKGAVKKRLAGMKALDWEIRTVENADPALAREQQTLLRTAYDRIENLVEAAGYLAMGNFTGISMMEKIKIDGTPFVRRFEKIPPWYLAYDRKTGQWLFNEHASGGILGEPIDPDSIIAFTNDEPIFQTAARNVFSKHLCLADWDLSLETWANPGIFFLMPDGATKEQQAVYQQMAEEYAANMRGVLPHGADIKTTDWGTRDNPSAEKRIKYCDEQIVLGATGGLLTMLTQSGSGTLAGGAHLSGLYDLYKSDASELSEAFQRQIDAPILNTYFPNLPQAAYFRFDVPKPEESLKEVLETVSTLSWVGLRIPPAVLAEKIGFMLEPIPGKE